MTTNETIAEWDERFWKDTKSLCLDCMPPALAKEMRRQFASVKGPIGHTGGSDPCTECGRSRLEVLAKSRVPIPVGPGRNGMTEADYGRRLARPAPPGEGPVGPPGVAGTGPLPSGTWKRFGG